MKKIFLIIIFSLLLIPSVWAAMRYVNPACSNGVTTAIGTSACTGGSDTVHDTIQHAADVVNPGDTVIVKDGTYTDMNADDYIVMLMRGGTSSNWITFKAENKWGAVLDGQNDTSNGWGCYTNCQYVRIEGFEIKNTVMQGFSIPYRSTSPFQNNIYFYGNKVHDVARKIIYCNDSDKEIGHDAFVAMETPSYITVDSNVVYNIGRLPGGGCNDWDDYNKDHGIYFRSNHNTIINNVFYNCNAGWPIQVDGRDGTDDWKIINNTFYGSNPMEPGQIILWGSASNITIQNNISHSSATAFIDGSWQTEAKTNVNIKNNLVYNAGVINVSGSEYHLSNNITGQDPMFIDLPNKDFHIQSSSPARDSGLNTNAPAYDFEANARPYNTTVDIGAYESCAAGGATAYNIVYGVSDTRTDCSDFSGANSLTVGDYQTWKMMFSFGQFFICVDSTDSSISTSCARDGSCDADDAFKIVLSPTNNFGDGTDIELVLSFNGNKKDSSVTLGTAKDLPIQSRVTTAGGHTYLWVAIPLTNLYTSIPQAGDVWGLKACEINGSSQSYVEKCVTEGTLTFGVPTAPYARLGN